MESMTEPSRIMLNVRSLSVSYGTTAVLNEVSFSVSAGKTLVLLGESGCGKTTLLRTLAGFVPVAAGDVVLNGTSVADMDARQRGILYLDQEPLLFEHLNVAENIGFALRIQGRPGFDIEQQTQQMLSVLDLQEHAHKYESQLSGGQKQRVAFARAILARPYLLLLDEPFCSLDARTRGQMQQLFAELSHQFGLTSVFVTHDVREALTVGHEFGRLSSGSLHLYADRNAFMSDEATGIPAEIRFWQAQASVPDGT